MVVFTVSFFAFVECNVAPLTATAMDTYDAITQSTYQASPSRSSTPKPQQATDGSNAQATTPRPEPPRQNLQTEFQETFKAFSNSPWGARLGGWWSTTAKQGQSYYAEAVREAEDLRVDALKGLSGLKETLVEGVKTRTRGTTKAHDQAGTGEGDDADRTLQETETFLDKFRAEAAKRLKEVQAAEDAADVALLRFGDNIRSFLKDAVSMDQSGRRIVHASRLDGQLYVIHTTPGQFIRDPDDDSNEVWIKWKQDFDVEKQTETIAKDLEKYPELRRTMEQVMKEQEVEYRDFWTRYYYLRMVVEEREEKRKALLKGRTNTVTDSTATLNNPKNGLLKPFEGRRSHDEKSVADSEASYDIVSGAPSRAASSPKQKRVDESDEEDWDNDEIFKAAKDASDLLVALYFSPEHRNASPERPEPPILKHLIGFMLTTMAEYWTPLMPMSKTLELAARLADDPVAYAAEGNVMLAGMRQQEEEEHVDTWPPFDPELFNDAIGRDFMARKIVLDDSRQSWFGMPPGKIYNWSEAVREEARRQELESERRVASTE
ncbi:hypothetical protein DV738_g1371, partial [Chaetothyriales sp. CBS 135597]